MILRDVWIWHKHSFTEIKADIQKRYGSYPIYPDSEAAADNTDLLNLNMQVVPVVFNKEKEYLISRIRWRFENRLILFPNPETVKDEKRGDSTLRKNLSEFLGQLKSYHYDEKTGAVVKVRDHCCDSMICGVKHLESLIDKSKPIFISG